MEVGQMLEGGKGRYQLIRRIGVGGHQSTVFQAKVLPGNRAKVASERVLIKTAKPGNEDTSDNLWREYHAYKKGGIASSSYIRSLHDVVEDPKDRADGKSTSPSCLVLEWMDCTLAELSPDSYRNNRIFLKTLIRASLSALAAFKEEGLVYTDFKPANVLLSNVDTGQPIIKLGDLGLTYPDGLPAFAQPVAMRAPEVHSRLGCSHPADVWAFAVTLIDWIQPGIFGRGHSKWELERPDISPEAWSIARLKLLFPDWESGPVHNSIAESDFEIGKLLADGSDPDEPGQPILKVSSLEHEMQKIPMPQAARKFLKYLLVVDPKKRPSAIRALKSEELLAL